MNMFGIAENVTGVIQNIMKQWKTEMTAGNQYIGPKVCIKRAPNENIVQNHSNIALFNIS